MYPSTTILRTYYLTIYYADPSSHSSYSSSLSYCSSSLNLLLIHLLHHHYHIVHLLHPLHSLLSSSSFLLRFPKGFNIFFTFRGILPFAVLHSSKTAFKRSSNSPLYFAPAIPRNVSGTSPSKMRLARPVFTTPG